MERALIGPGFVEDALDCVRARGLDPRPLLACADLPAEVSAPISNVQYGRLWWQIALAMEDEFFGLAARPMRPGSFTLLCQAALHAGTLERALRRALAFLAVVLDDPRGELRQRGGEAEILLVDRGGPRPALAYRTYWLIVMGVACWLIGQRIPLRGVAFACPAPEHRLDYRQFFGAPVTFDRAQCRLAFDAAFLRRPIIRDEAALKVFLRAAPANILLGYRHDDGLAQRVRARLGAAAPADWPDFDGLASDLAMSPATLRRRLAAEGQSYGAIKDAIRLGLARRLLRRANLSVADVAAELGYSEPTAFHRAFRGWTGASPGAFRREQVRREHQS